MIITYHGASCFKVQFGETVLAFNPISKQSTRYKPTRFKADIALVSAVHPDCSGVEQVRQGDHDPFVIRGPGEYEVRGVTVQGFLSSSEYDGEKRHNTIYTIEFEGMTLCFLGILGEREISQQAMEAIEDIDILFVPIGGNGALDASGAYKLAVSLEPRVIIPMLYDHTSAQQGGLQRFLDEGGVKTAEAQEKLTVKQKDVAGMEGEIVVLEAQSQ